MTGRQSLPGCVSRVAGRQPITRILRAAGVGVASRCAGMVRGGRVAADGRVIKDPRTRVEPFRQAITLDGRPLPPIKACRYLLLNKPYGVLCAFTDRDGRPTLADYVPVPGVYAAGRLDLDSEGLLLLTDDGWLIHRLAHPKHRHRKVYLVQVERVPDRQALEALRGGPMVKGRPSLPAEVELLKAPPALQPRSRPVRYRKSVPTAWLSLTLTEGRKRQVRHMTAAVGHPTLRLVRVAIGTLELGDLDAGEWRYLTADELDGLKAELHPHMRG